MFYEFLICVFSNLGTVAAGQQAAVQLCLAEGQARVPTPARTGGDYTWRNGAVVGADVHPTGRTSTISTRESFRVEAATGGAQGYGRCPAAHFTIQVRYLSSPPPYTVALCC